MATLFCYVFGESLYIVYFGAELFIINTKMRITPKDKYIYEPCSFVSTGCAYEDIMGKTFDAELPGGLRDNGVV